jgi:hypothetical protein
MGDVVPVVVGWSGVAQSKFLYVTEKSSEPEPNASEAVAHGHFVAKVVVREAARLQ